MKNEKTSLNNDELVNNLMNLIIEVRKEIKEKKDFALSDKLRDGLSKAKINIKDTKYGTTWEVEK